MGLARKAQRIAMRKVQAFFDEYAPDGLRFLSPSSSGDADGAAAAGDGDSDEARRPRSAATESASTDGSLRSSSPT